LDHQQQQKSIQQKGAKTYRFY